MIGAKLYAMQAAQGSPDKQTASLMAASLMAESEEKLKAHLPLNEIAQPAGQTRDGIDPRFTYEIVAIRGNEATGPGTPLPANLVLIDVIVNWTNDDDARVGRFKLHSRFTEI